MAVWPVGAWEVDMPLTAKMSAEAAAAGASGPNPFAEGMEKRKTDKLTAYLKGEQIKANAAAAEDYATRTGQKPGTFQLQASESGYNVNPETVKTQKLQLTPAQTSAEKETGKQLATYLAGGGKATVDKALSAIGDVEGGMDQRDGWDHYVGGALATHPTLQGLLAPKEKSRSDAMRSAASGLARTEDANPTQQQINMIYGQIYDPSSDTKTNKERIARFSAQKKQEAEAKQKAADHYTQTGYATMDGGGMGYAPAPADEEEDLDSAPETKEVNGQWYEKVPGGWKAMK